MSNEDLVNKAYDYLNNGHVDLSEKILEELKDETIEFKYQIGALLIDIGLVSKNMDYVDEGIEIFEDLKESTNINVNYNLANGYFAKFVLNKSNYLIKDDHLLFKAKKLYREEINHTAPQENPDLYINLANAYNNIGRTIDGLEYYEIVLDISKDSRALVNKGIALYQYSFFTIDYLVILKDAYKCFKLALADSGLYSDFKDISEKYVNIIEEDLNEKILNQEIPDDLQRPSDDDFEGFMINFCLDNKLYLNLCNFCQRCDNAIGDTLLMPDMLVEIGTPLEEDPYLKLSSQLNQIKLDYVISRFLLILSQSETPLLNLISKNTILTETFSYEENNSSSQLLKNSVTGFYNILDKISHLINIYFKLEKDPKNVNFHKVWYNNKGKIHGKLRSLNNLGLNALYDIHLELEHDYEKFYLRKMRNNLTHNFVPIKLVKLKDNDMTYDELRNNTLELAKIVKNAIIYLIRAIDINERKRFEENKSKIIPKMHSRTIKL